MRTTPLAEWHQQHGARMAEFGGYLMPMEYEGILAEHQMVREHVGMFDVSHMGEFEVRGPAAAGFLDRLLTNPPSRLDVGQALYAVLCDLEGGCVDDLLVYRLAADRFWLVVNAANHDPDWEWIRREAPNSVLLTDWSDKLALIAVQGPDSVKALERLTAFPIGDIGRYRFACPVPLLDIWALVARTGYTGEDGFECCLPSSQATALWTRLFGMGVPPIGLGARDTLRLEARLPLYGHELSREISPLTAGLSRFVRLDDGRDFIGGDALRRQRAVGLAQQLAGLQLDGPGIARSGYPVGVDEHPIGQVTSGSYAPSLKKAVALALVPAEYARQGTRLWVEIRGRRVSATVVPTPFYRQAPRR